MPHIQISDVTGRSYTITSSDNKTVARWLIETLTLVTTPNQAYAHINIRVSPLWVGPEIGGAWDWHPAANKSFVEALTNTTPTGNIRDLAHRLLDYAGKCEEDKWT